MPIMIVTGGDMKYRPTITQPLRAKMDYNATALFLGVSMIRGFSMTVTLFRSDFKDEADSPHTSLFETLLCQLDIPEKDRADIGGIDIEVSDYRTE